MNFVIDVVSMQSRSPRPTQINEDKKPSDRSSFRHRYIRTNYIFYFPQDTGTDRKINTKGEGVISYLSTHAANNGDSIRRSDTRTFRTCPTSGSASLAHTSIRTTNKGLRIARVFVDDAPLPVAHRASPRSSSRVNLCNNCQRGSSRMSYCSRLANKREEKNSDCALYTAKGCTEFCVQPKLYSAREII